MKKLTKGQMQALVTAIDAGIFPDTDTEPLRAAVEKLREGVRTYTTFRRRKHLRDVVDTTETLLRG